MHKSDRLGGVAVAPSSHIPATDGGPDGAAAPSHPPVRQASLAGPQADVFYDGTGSTGLLQQSDYATFGGKWGPSGTFGTSGGTVTWSIAGAGYANASGTSWFTGSTVALSSFLNFDYVSVLAQAFAAWSAVANITFVQVADGGGNLGTGTSGYIRLGGGYMDGPSNTLAAAFSPGYAGNAQNSALSGDVIFDSGETTFWNASSFLAVATHEIGHALGLDHTSVANSLMNPYYNASITTPQADDIAGIRAIYGPAVAASVPSISIGDVNITEGNSGQSTATFTVTRTGGTSAFTVNYATNAQTATAGVDYVAASGTLSFAAGVNTQTISVIVNGDTTSEPNETFTVNLSGATGGTTIADSIGLATIVNDDATNTDDYAAGTGTSGTVRLGARLNGNLEVAGDHDWVGVQLYSGLTYQFNVRGQGEGGGTLSDPTLTLRDASGNSLVYNDDAIGNDPQITYAATSNGRFHLDVGGYGNGYAGTYGVDVVARNPLANSKNFDGNVASDILWRSTSGDAVTWEKLSGTTHTGQSLGNVGNNWTINGAGDVNQDGKSDLVWRSSAGEVVTWNSLSNASHVGTSYGTVTSEWSIRGVGDVDKDGKSDLFWRSTNGDVVTWTNLKADGTHVTHSYGNVGREWHIVGTGDFDGDQKSDILWRSDNGGVYVWSNLQADGSKNGFSLGNVDLGWHIAGTGDFNADGKSDILWRSDSGDVVTWENILSNGTHVTRALGNVGTDWSIADVADYGGDGQSDILWRSTDGRTLTWEHIAGLQHDSQFLGTVGNDWSVQHTNYEIV